MVRFLDPEIVEKVDKSYIDIRRGYWGAAPSIRETRKCSLRTPRLPRLLMEEHLRDHWIGEWLKSRSVCGAVPYGGAGPFVLIVNGCYIPRVVVEIEDKEAKKKGLE